MLLIFLREGKWGSGSRIQFHNIIHDTIIAGFAPNLRLLGLGYTSIIFLKNHLYL